MKNILLLLTLLILAVPIFGQDICGNPEREPLPIPADLLAQIIAQTPDGILPSKVFVQIDYDIVLDKGIDAVIAWSEELMNESAVPYGWIDVELCFSFDFLTSPTYTDGNSYEMLRQFKAKATSFDADVAIMLSYKSSGGIAWVDQACRLSSEFRYSFASVRSTFTPWADGYNWNPEVIAHELGHLYGCGHTQDRTYTINGVPNQPIDGCWPNPGDDPGPIPVDGGTIMSYCHLRPDVGINFAKGFHPIHAAIIRATVANGCISCGDDGGGGDPPVVTCEDNPLFINLILDDYPDETRYIVINSEGDTIHQNGPFARYASDGSRMTGEVIADTLCLPDGCYAFTIIDKNGLGGEDCNEGLYYIGDPFGELASGQQFTNSETTQFSFNCDPPTGDCHPATIRKATLVDYANQSRARFPTVTDVAGGDGVEIAGNYWQAQPVDYTLTPRTVLTGEVWVEDEGEINGVALVGNLNGIYPGRSFRFAGTQAWGIAVEQVPIGGWHPISIEVGQYLPSTTISHLVLVNDDDVAGSVQTAWRNFELCESGAGIINKAALTQVQGTVEDEMWTTKAPYPNPVVDTLYLDYKDSWFLYSIDGFSINWGYGDQVSFGGLPIGAYVLRHGDEVHKIMKQ